MHKLTRFFYLTFKGIYDLLAVYVLVVMLYLTLVSLGLHGLFALLAQALGHGEVEHMWWALARHLDVSELWLRLAIYGLLQASIFWGTGGLIQQAIKRAERWGDRLQRAYLWATQRPTKTSRALGIALSILLTLLLVPFLIQPTLVPMKLTQRTIVQRAANLLDGQATLGFADSVVGFYRKLYAQPDAGHGLKEEQLDTAFRHLEDASGTGPLFPPKANGSQPLMDRWDEMIALAALQDDAQFAFIKAFMWVESGGRQFALSHTGCSGLMQFCAGTARRHPFKKVFGTGQVYRCQCEGPCTVPKKVQKEMELGDERRINDLARTGAFPCEVTDARYNAQKAIVAGSLYIKSLRTSFQDNIYLMYIGYNSGPAVARMVYNALGQRSGLTLEEIEPELTKALGHWYGDKAASRSRSLVRTHLPKLKKAYDRYHHARVTLAQDTL